MFRTPGEETPGGPNEDDKNQPEEQLQNQILIDQPAPLGIRIEPNGIPDSRVEPDFFGVQGIEEEIPPNHISAPRIQPYGSSSWPPSAAPEKVDEESVISGPEVIELEDLEASPPKHRNTIQ